MSSLALECHRLTKPAADQKRSPQQSIRGSQREDQETGEHLAKMKTLLESIHNKVRLVKLRQYEANSKLGFSLRGGKEATGSSVGVFVSHVELRSEADKKGLRIGDRLMQVNGLSVNQATYDEVIGLIKRTPRSQDIVLKVTNFGKIPFQEKPGDLIRWLPVIDLLESQLVKWNESAAEKEEPEEAMAPALEPNPKAFSLSSDEGIESCESQRAHSLSGESDQSDTCSPSKSYRQAADPGSHDDSALSSTLTLSNDEAECCSCSSACSISISVSSENSSTAAAGPLDQAEDSHIRVPGGRRSSEPFGCGVVKGPEEWPGIFVQNVRPGSLAERVGLQPGDQLLEADGQPLQELTFELAINLIKRLQQQQEELLLLVRKGAALKHLASSRLQHQASLTASAAVALEQEKRQKPSQASPERKETPASNSCRLTQQVELGEAAPPPKDSATSAECAPEPLLRVSADLISDTQSQLSGKLADDQQKVACTANMEMRKWSSKPKLTEQQQVVVSSQVDRGRRLTEQRRLLKAPPAERQSTTASSQWQFRRQQAAEPDATSTVDPSTGASPQRQERDANDTAKASKMRYREEVEEEDEEIRIVQNCKLYHQSGQGFIKKASILHEKFPHLAPRRSAQVQVSPARPSQAPSQVRKMQPPPTAARRHQTVDDMRRQLDSRTRAGAPLQRYVSMDNLWAAQRPQQVQARPQVRGVSACRQEPQDFYCSRAELQASGAIDRQQRLYRRSNSVMSQSALGVCCVPTGSELSDCTARTCCLQQQPPHPPRCVSVARKYSNTIGAPLALSRAKARSMDKLNMNINLNYVNIGMSHYQAVQRHPPQAGSAPKQLRAAGGHLPACCGPSAAGVPVYNYTTAARMISTTKSPPRLPNRLAVTCCETARERHALSQPLAKGARLSGQATCCELSAGAPIYAPVQHPRDFSSKPAYTLVSSRAPYACCPLACCPPAPESIVCGLSSRREQTSRSRKYNVNVTDSSTDSGRYAETRQPRLLKVCKAPQPPPPPPPPPMETGACRSPACLMTQRDTRQRLTTFSGRQVSASEVSPTSSSYSGTSAASSSPSASSASSSPSASSPTSASSITANESSLSDGRSASPVNCRQVRPQKRLPAPAAPETHHIPRPPPLPAQDLDFECKMSNGLKRQPKQSSGRQISALGERQSKAEATKVDRLCFVDELKMLAKRQQQSSQLAKTGHPAQASLDSSTLIKIINASKPSSNRKVCSCQAGQRQSELSNAEAAVCAAAKCSRSGHKSTHESKSVKLTDEDNKRRQHEMLMKEFKSAHSRMFKQRAAKLEEENARDNNQQVGYDGEKPAKRTAIKSIAAALANNNNNNNNNVNNNLLPVQAAI